MILYRNFIGELDFDHKNSSLNITVCPQGGDTVIKRDLKGKTMIICVWAENTHLLRKGITVSADLLFILFGFSCFTFAELVKYFLVWLNPNQSSRKLVSDLWFVLSSRAGSRMDPSLRQIHLRVEHNWIEQTV